MYYYIKKINAIKEGPLTLEEVLKNRLTDDVLVSRDGMPWIKISEVPELAHAVIKTPPPLPEEQENRRKEDERKRDQEVKDKAQIDKETNKAIKKKEKLNVIRTSLIIGFFIAAFLSWLLALYCESGGTNEYPIYHGYGKNNWEDFYFGLFIYALPVIELIALIISGLKIFTIKEKNTFKSLPLNDSTTIEFVEKIYNTNRGILTVKQRSAYSPQIGDRAYQDKVIFAPDGNYELVDNYPNNPDFLPYSIIVIKLGKISNLIML